MFGIGMPEMILILAIALIVLGPKKLPELAKSLGKGIAEFKRAAQDFKDTIDMEDEVNKVKETYDEIKNDVNDTLKKPDIFIKNEKNNNLKDKNNNEISSKLDNQNNNIPLDKSNVSISKDNNNIIEIDNEKK